MPSKDPINAAANAWMGDLAPKVVPLEGRQVSGFLLRLARRLGKDPDALAADIEPDTIRRTKYPVLERAEGERRLYEHDTGIDS